MPPNWSAVSASIACRELTARESRRDVRTVNRVAAPPNGGYPRTMRRIAPPIAGLVLIAVVVSVGLYWQTIVGAITLERCVEVRDGVPVIAYHRKRFGEHKGQLHGTYVVSRRTRELGIRMALGATPRDVLWMILREGLVLTGIGIGLGLVLALLIGQLLAIVLYEVSPSDPVTFVVASLGLAAAAAAAALLPALRATRIAPTTALRYE